MNWKLLVFQSMVYRIGGALMVDRLGTRWTTRDSLVQGPFWKQLTSSSVFLIAKAC